MRESDSLPQQLDAFCAWARAHCQGNERGEAQVFLDRFFQCFGLGGVLEAGGTFEQSQKWSSAKGKTGFLDCLLPGKVIIEMKKRGAPLALHYNQLLTYWTHCVPKPTVGVLCNFDEFWIYDFNVQVDTPVQTLTLATLAKHPEALRFMIGQTPDFGRNMVSITEEAASEISALYRSILERREQFCASEEDIQRFVLQCVLCLFAEDIGLFPEENLFTNLLNDCQRRPQDTYHVLQSLFKQMNSPQIAGAGRFKGVRYFNGGLFSTITPVELTADELATLYRIGHDFHWGDVRPSIFGTVFEKAIGHYQGSHFTSEVDIYKIVNPTIVRYWNERIDAADESIKKLHQCLNDLRRYKVLDPACGSGNFLYIAYQEMKRLEKRLMDLIKDHARTAKDAVGTDISLVSPKQFYGIEIKPFAVELARLTLEIGRKVAVNKFGLNEDVLPLDNLNHNIICADALFTPWPQADAIIGNPPFIGEKRMRAELGDAYVDKIYSHYREIPNNVDYCAYWFKLAHDHDAPRVGLVGTNSIGQGQTRKAGLDYIVAHGGAIHDAVSTQDWPGEANLDVSIVNWLKGRTPKTCFLDEAPVERINSSLKAGMSFAGATPLAKNRGFCFQGVIPVGKGFLIDDAQVAQWIQADPKNAEILIRFSMGENLTDRPDYLSDRWIIDFNGFSIEEASRFQAPFRHIEQWVKPERLKLAPKNSTNQKRREFWWKPGCDPKGMRAALLSLSYCFAIPRVSKWHVFIRFPHKQMLAGDKTVIVASEDYYVLGVLNSMLHRQWIDVQKSTLEDRTAYTHTTCFETFPFLWDAPEALKQPVRDVMSELDAYRMGEMQARQWGITKLYNAFFHEPASRLHQLHRQLDAAVCRAYGWKYDPDKNYNEDLFHLNQRLYEQEQIPLLAGLKPKRTRSRRDRGA